MALKSLRDVDAALAAQQQKMDTGFAGLQQMLLQVIQQANPQFAQTAPSLPVAAGTPSVPAQLPAGQVTSDEETEPQESPESVIAIRDAADLPAGPKPKADRGAARDTMAGSFRLRRTGSSGGGSITPSTTPKAKGLAGAPIYDDTTRKVTVKVKDRVTGVTKNEEKTVNLHDDTRNVVGPLLAQQYVTIEDADETHASRGARAIRLAMIDDQGKAIPGTSCRLLFGTSESGSFMLQGEITVKVPIVDDKGVKGTVIFEPAARGMIYLMGKTFVRDTK